MAGLAAAGCGRKRPPPPGSRKGVDSDSGHRLRDGEIPQQVGRRESCHTAILGGGMAALSAAWRMSRAGFEDYQLYELEGQVGGNSRAEDYQFSQAPWGAHYLPVPTRESWAVRELLREMDLYHGEVNGRPQYDDFHLCHSLEERLFILDEWQEGLFPRVGATREDLAEFKRFQEHIEGWQNWRDSEGRKAFALPISASSRDPEVLALDQISFADYARRQDWTSKELLWYLDYACRDDYGGLAANCSAWAGLHYFASRDGGGLEKAGALFVWPEGNARLVEHLRSYVEGRVRSRALVLRVGDSDFDYLDLEKGERVRVDCRRIVCALPTYQRPYLITGEEPRPFTYSPWVTANLVMSRFPSELLTMTRLAWDNVIYDSPSLGYVVATHQSLSQTLARPTVFTWYRPFPEDDTKATRARLLKSRWQDWSAEILAELVRVHPNIEEVIQRIDVMIAGHAMIRPTPGFIWSSQLTEARHPRQNIHFAHSDLSGISIFEEAQDQGLRAAEEVLGALGLKYETWRPFAKRA